MFKGEMLRTVVGLVLGLIGIGVVGLFFFYSERVKIERTLVDASTHCPIERKKTIWGIVEVVPPATTRKTAVLIDATDRIPKEQRDSIGEWFRNSFTNMLIRFEEVAIFEVVPNDFVDESIPGEPYFNRCTPPIVANKWIENPRIVRKKFEKTFMQKKIQIIRSLASQREKRWSPILEKVTKLFRTYDRVILVSDLMQNTPKCFLYKIKGKNRILSTCMVHYSNQFNGKILNVIFLKRKRLYAIQDASLLQFWRNFAETNEGRFALVHEPPAIQ